jgi:hypothetical protein
MGLRISRLQLAAQILGEGLEVLHMTLYDVTNCLILEVEASQDTSWSLPMEMSTMMRRTDGW